MDSHEVMIPTNQKAIYPVTLSTDTGIEVPERVKIVEFQPCQVKWMKEYR